MLHMMDVIIMGSTVCQATVADDAALLLLILNEEVECVYKYEVECVYR